MMLPRILTIMFLACFLAGSAWGQAALRSVTAARELDQRKPAPAAAKPAKEHAPPDRAGGARKASGGGADHLPTEPHDREAKRASAMFSKVLLAFNNREHGKRIMTQHAPRYRLENWYYFPVRIKSLTSRKVDDRTIMVNPVTGKFKLEGAATRKEGP